MPLLWIAFSNFRSASGARYSQKVFILLSSCPSLLPIVRHIGCLYGCVHGSVACFSFHRRIVYGSLCIPVPMPDWLVIPVRSLLPPAWETALGCAGYLPVFYITVINKRMFANDLKSGKAFEVYVSFILLFAQAGNASLPVLEEGRLIGERWRDTPPDFPSLISFYGKADLRVLRLYLIMS